MVSDICPEKELKAVVIQRNKIALSFKKTIEINLSNGLIK